MTLLDQISDALGASGALGDLSNTLGASASDTDSLISAGLPAILGGLGAQSGDGIGALMGLLGDDKGGLAGNLGSFFGQGDKTGLASKLIGSLFGSQRGAIESQVASDSGGAMSMVSRLLPMLAPAVMSLLGKITADEEIDADGLTEKLGALGISGPLGDILGAGSDEDKAGFVEGIASIRDAGGLGALVPAAAAVAPATAAAGTAAVNQLASTADDDDSDRSGLGWLPSILLPVLALIAGLVLWQCTSDANDPEPVAEVVEEVAEAPAAVTIADLAVGSPDLSTLVGLVTDLGLAGTLADANAGPFTVFAPTNAAFEAAGPVLGELNGAQVETAVTYHVVPGVYTAADLAGGAELTTVAGETLVIEPGPALPGGINVVTADLEADNGIVHIIDGVLVPQSILDALAPEPTPEPTPEPEPTPTPAPVVTIADLALGSPDLSTLVSIASQFNLVGPLADADAGPFTVFAPTNDAFEAAGGVLERLDGGQTATTVGFHVVPGIYTSADLTPGTTLETTVGELLTVQPDGTLSGGISVVTADLEADNGVVHIVEGVLVPGSIRRALASDDVNTLFQLEPIQFDLGQATIRPESVATLDQAIATLTSLPAGTVFEVQGHTDSQGADASNQELSEARAASVVAYLTDGGVDPDMLVPVGYGESQLKVDPEVTPEDFEANRRIEFLDISS